MISSDKPIKDLKDDKLERKEFIENIFEIIKKQLNKDGVVFGIEGKWGSGKTSILNILENKLVSEEILVFKFNPWNFSTRKQLISDFFEQFSLFIGSRTSMKEDFKEVSKKLKIISSLMKPIGIIPGVSPIISIVENGANIVAKTLDDYSDGKDFETIKKELEIHLENREDRIIVFIDDIDRLPDDEIREIFQLVKGVGDLNNITYLISYDRRIVVEALNKTQEKKGEEYLEKIIQLEFKLPKIKLEMITDIFFKKYLLLVNDIKEEKNNIGKYKELYMNGLFNRIQSFRDINKILNNIFFALNYAKKELYLPEFLVIKILENFESKIIEYIYFNKQEFIKTRNDYFRNEKKEERAKRVKLFLKENVKVFSFEEIDSILGSIFPDMIRESSDYRRFIYVNEIENHIYNERHFYKYFKYNLSNDEISNIEIEEFFNFDKKNSIKIKIKELILENRIREFLDSILENINKYFNNNNILMILETLINLSNEINDSDASEDFWFNSIDTKIERMIYLFLKNNNDKFKSYEELIEKSQINYHLISLLCYFEEKQEIFSIQEIENLKIKLIKKLKDKFLVSKKYEQRMLLIFYKLKKWDEKKLLEDFINEHLKSDKKLIKLINLFVSERKEYIHTDVITTRYISKETVNDFLNYEEIKNRLERIKCTKKDQEVVELFLNAKEKGEDDF